MTTFNLPTWVDKLPAYEPDTLYGSMRSLQRAMNAVSVSVSREWEKMLLGGPVQPVNQWERYRGPFALEMRDAHGRYVVLELPNLAMQFRPHSVTIHNWPRMDGGPAAYADIQFRGMSWEVEIVGDVEVEQGGVNRRRVEFEGDIRALSYTGGPVDMGGEGLAPIDPPADPEPPRRLGPADFADIRRGLGTE